MLQVKNITYAYHPQSSVLNQISFKLKKGEHLCVMGESGCGKSTLLKAIYGLLDLNQGSIMWDDIPILGPAYNLVPGVKFFKYVAQDLDLMPVTSVYDNISKYLSRIHQEETHQRTYELLEVIEMSEYAETIVKTLSGGQQQRVAIARALAKEPELLILDEPFSQIDNFKKNSLRRTLFSYLKKKNIACIIATHDSNDALSFADQMLVIKDHKIIAKDSPKILYKTPRNKYVATLFDDINDITIDGENHLIYPHQIEISPHSKLKAVVLDSYFKGSFWLIVARYHHQKIYLNHYKSIENNSTIGLKFNL